MDCIVFFVYLKCCNGATTKTNTTMTNSMTKTTTAKATTFTYQTAKGLNVETFEGCDITLMRDGLFVYENWVSSLMMPFYIHQLEEELIKRGIEYTKEEK